MVVDSFEHAGLWVEIVAEEYVEEFYNPRTNDEGIIGTMFTYHPDYELGDERLPRDGFDPIICPKCEGAGEVLATHHVECDRCAGCGKVEPTVEEWLREQNAIAAMPLFLLDHSGVSMSAGRFIWLPNDDEVTAGDVASRDRFIGDEAGWDTMFIGFIITTRERCEKVGVPKITPEAIEQDLRTEVREYTRYLEGDCGGYQVLTEEGGEVLDSCWGILGLNEDYVREEAKAAAEWCARETEHEKREREHWAARDVVTVDL